MSATLPQRIAAAYRWHKRLGAAAVIETPVCAIVVDPAKPEVWNCNHADDVRAEAADEIEAVFSAMERHLSHSRWRVVDTDGSTPDPFLARLAFDGYRERPTAIQMALRGAAADVATKVDLRVVESDADWARLQALAMLNFAEGRTTAKLEIDRETGLGLVANSRAKSPQCRFYLVWERGEAIAYGSAAAAPNGLGMIEDVFTQPGDRSRGVASAMLAWLAADLRSRGCDVVFLGALADETAKRLYRRLGFEPVSVARCWVKPVAD